MYNILNLLLQSRKGIGEYQKQDNKEELRKNNDFLKKRKRVLHFTRKFLTKK